MAPTKAIDKRWHQVNLRNGKEFELEEAKACCERVDAQS